MVTCKHESCGRENQVWLPTSNYSSETALHPWCINCGLVKNISDDRPHNLGYWINILSRISKRFSLKKVQTRLVSKYLESHIDFNDLYGITYSAQSELFVKTVTRICKISEHLIYTSIY